MLKMVRFLQLETLTLLGAWLLETLTLLGAWLLGNLTLLGAWLWVNLLRSVRSYGWQFFEVCDYHLSLHVAMASLFKRRTLFPLQPIIHLYLLIQRILHFLLLESFSLLGNYWTHWFFTLCYPSTLRNLLLLSLGLFYHHPFWGKRALLWILIAQNPLLTRWRLILKLKLIVFYLALGSTILGQ